MTLLAKLPDSITVIVEQYTLISAVFGRLR